MCVAYPTTPAQIFHLLRRQMILPYRKPLIIVGPKTLLRHPDCISDIKEMESGSSFRPLLPDSSITLPAQVERVIFMSGKIYYELVKARRELSLDSKVAIVRVEELCPFPAQEISRLVADFSGAKDFFWVQEEPQNQGAYTFVSSRLGQLLPSGKRVC